MLRIQFLGLLDKRVFLVNKSKKVIISESNSELEDRYPIIIEIFNVVPNYALCVSVYKLLHNCGVCDLRFYCTNSCGAFK